MAGKPVVSPLTQNKESWPPLAGGPTTRKQESCPGGGGGAMGQVRFTVISSNRGCHHAFHDSLFDCQFQIVHCCSLSLFCLGIETRILPCAMLCAESAVTCWSLVRKHLQ